MSKSTLSLSFLSLLFLTTSPLLADHGREFLTVQDAHVGSLGHGSVGLNGGWTREADSMEEYHLEGNLTLPVMDRLALGADLGFDDTDGGLGYSGISPHFLLDLTPKKSPLRFSLMAGYQFAAAKQEALPAPHADHVAGDAHGVEEHAASENQNEHEHGGTHQHGVSGWQARIITEMDLTDDTKVVLNLVYFNPEHGKPALGYAAGLRKMLTNQIGVGVEALGDFEAGGSHEALLACYFSPIHDLTIKAGLGMGLTNESPDLNIRLGVVWRF